MKGTSCGQVYSGVQENFELWDLDQDLDNDRLRCAIDGMRNKGKGDSSQRGKQRANYKREVKKLTAFFIICY